MEQLEVLLHDHDHELNPFATLFEVTGWLKKDKMKFVKTFYEESQLREFVHECLHSDTCYIQQIVVHYTVSMMD